MFKTEFNLLTLEDCEIELGFENAHVIQYHSCSLYNQVPVLRGVQCLTKCSFLVHKSIDYLDLCVHENPRLSAKNYSTASRLFNTKKEHPLYNKFINTQEMFRKAMMPDRKLLYTFHLDPPKNREPSLRVVSYLFYSRDPQSIICDTINVSDIEYEDSIRNFIMCSFERLNIQTRQMRGLLRLMKHVVSYERPLRNDEAYKIFRVMLRKCSDSDLVREFISMRNFTKWFFYGLKKTQYLDFILRHVRQTTYVLEKRHSMFNHPFKIDAINWLIVCSKYRDNLEVLLRYQDQPSKKCFDYKLLFDACVEESHVGTYFAPSELQLPVQLHQIKKRRYFLLLQVLRVFFDKDQKADKGCLRILWRSLPDSFFTSDELIFFTRKMPRQMRVSLRDFYKGIADDDISISKPRSLQHYSRVAIRKQLCQNKMLPEGIAQLGLGQALQAYLRLEI